MGAIGIEPSRAIGPRGRFPAENEIAVAPNNLDRFIAMRAFASVGQKLSFVEAAEELKISPSALSRRVTQLERALGCRLLQRTTRRVTLTEAGELYLERCLDILARADEADAMVSLHVGEPQGVLRIALPNLFGQKVVAPTLPLFMERYPLLRLELSFDDRFVDLVEKRADVGVRIGDLVVGDYIARKLAPNPRYLCASPAYVEKHGMPPSIERLSDHACLQFSPLALGSSWQLTNQDRTVVLPIDPVLRADNAEALRQAALGGRGVALLADFVIREDLEAGRLLEVLPEWRVADSWVYAVYPNATHLPMKVRVFIDHLVSHLQPRAAAGGSS